MKTRLAVMIGCVALLLLFGSVNVNMAVADDAAAGITSQGTAASPGEKHNEAERQATDFVANAHLANQYHGLFSTATGYGLLIESDDYEVGQALAYVVDPYGYIVGIPWYDGNTYYFFFLTLATRDLYGCPYLTCDSSSWNYIGVYN